LPCFDITVPLDPALSLLALKLDVASFMRQILLYTLCKVGEILALIKRADSQLGVIAIAPLIDALVVPRLLKHQHILKSTAYCEVQ
jgi:hypothetical protein